MTEAGPEEPERTNDFPRRPRFVCVGGATGGRWLYRQAASHPQVWMPPLEELRFFKGRWDLSRQEALERLGLITAEIYEGGKPVDPRDLEFLRRVWFKTGDASAGDVELYRKLVNIAGDSVIGDVSPQYAKLRPGGVAKLVRRTLPRSRFVYLADDPATRVWTAVRDRVRKGQADPAVLEDADLFAMYLQTPGLADGVLQSRIVELWTAKAGRRFAAFPFGLEGTNLRDVRRDLFAYIKLDGDLCTAEPAWSGRRGRRHPPLPLMPVIEEFLGDEPQRLRRAIEVSGRRPRRQTAPPRRWTSRFTWLPWPRRKAKSGGARH